MWIESHVTHEFSSRFFLFVSFCFFFYSHCFSWILNFNENFSLNEQYRIFFLYNWFVCFDQSKLSSCHRWWAQYCWFWQNKRIKKYTNLNQKINSFERKISSFNSKFHDLQLIHCCIVVSNVHRKRLLKFYRSCWFDKFFVKSCRS